MGRAPAAGYPEEKMQSSQGRPGPAVRPSEGKKVKHVRIGNANVARRFLVSNTVGVSPDDYGYHGDELFTLRLRNELGKKSFVSARCTPSSPPDAKLPKDYISLNKLQRNWVRITENQDEEMTAEEYSGLPALVGLDIEARFANTKDPKLTFREDDMKAQFQKTYANTVFAPKQQLWMDFGGTMLLLFVKTVHILGKHSSKSTSDPNSPGILPSHGCDEIWFQWVDIEETKHQFVRSINRPHSNAILRPDFKFADMGIGGLDDEFSVIFRRAFASRVFPPGLVEQMGISHVKGLLLYGPPGTGKTLIARQIGKMLNAREPKIINGPEILNKFVGQSEENVRKMFADAEKEYKQKKEDSDLHIIIFDELDAVCKQRGSGAGGGTGVGDSVVNQLLSKLDGVDQLNNILLIGMTNRKDLIDDALLRPGRLEVHVEISLPDENGRIQILNIHTAKIRAVNKLADDVDLNELARLTKNYSGAEISGLVKAALSYAFTRHTKLGDVTGVSGNPNDVMLKRGDLMKALDDVKPAFGVSEEELTNASPYGVIHYSPHIQSILSTGLSFVRATKTSEKSPLFSILLYGPRGAGKTALAAEIGLKSEFPFVKVVSSKDLGTNEATRLEHLRRTFSDAYKSALSIIILDSIEKIIDWNPIGPRFSNAIAGYLGDVLETRPPKGRKLLIIATTSQRSMLDQHGVFEFDREIAVPAVKDHRELEQLLMASGKFSGPDDINEALTELQNITGTQDIGIGVKAVFSALETASVRDSLPISLAEDISALMAARNPQEY
ncbi:Uu.00g074690.m01.CDS01 [Anthostomella pinea]|uniref:Vesicular-fusion protein SEC18 n=1 Tax=Anthostomella pinea TaxID=933095 RepID=A0AAI8VVJ1_9PEZI|nr:Uu.00g074690.m01.CDS01 [Anthostomella pinea]